MNRREWLEARLCDADIAGKSIEDLVYIKDELRKVDEAFEYLKFQ